MNPNSPDDALNLSPDHLKALYRVTFVMNSSLEFDAALQNIIEAVMDVVHAQRGYLIQVSETDPEDMQVLVARGTEGQAADEGYSTTIVNQVIKTRETLLTNNAQFDDRYQAGQSIIIRGLRAILCAPLMVKDRLIGVVYMDTSMRQGNFTPADRELMAAVAGQAAIALENARLYTLAVERGRLMQELQMAREIQQSLLPQQMPDVPGYEIAAHWNAAREVAGDFYDVFSIDGTRLIAVIADVSDKGAPAALFMAVARTMIRTLAHTGLGALDTIGRTNDLILEDAESGMFVTVYYSLYQADGQSQHVNAGHNPSVIYRGKEKRAFMMPRGGRAIGWFPDNPLVGRDIQLQPGDCVVYYTDGVTEAENAAAEPFGEERFLAVVERVGNNAAQIIVDEIMAAVDDFCGPVVPFDDQTLVVVRYNGVA